MLNATYCCLIVKLSQRLNNHNLPIPDQMDISITTIRLAENNLFGFYKNNFVLLSNNNFFKIHVVWFIGLNK